MSLSAALILAWLAFVVGLIAGLWLAEDAPVCVCGDVDCGGGCYRLGKCVVIATSRVGQFEIREVYVAAIHANVFDVFETGRRSRVWRALTQREAEAYIRGRTVGAGLP